MNRERLATFIGNLTHKMSDIYYDGDLSKYYVHYKETDIDNLGVIEYFSSEEEAELAATKYAFGEKYGERNI